MTQGTSVFRCRYDAPTERTLKGNRPRDRLLQRDARADRMAYGDHMSTDPRSAKSSRDILLDGLFGAGLALGGGMILRWRA